VNNKFSILSLSIAAPLIWDIDGVSRGHERPPTLLGCSGHHQVERFHSGV
jgi:hypothetical protein